MRRSLYKLRRMPADMVLDPWIRVPRVIHSDGFGIRIDEETVATDPQNPILGHHFRNQLRTEEDIARIRAPIIRHDPEADRMRLESATDAFGGTVPVQLSGDTACLALWDRLVEWMSPEGILLDLVDRPDFLHAAMERYTEASLSYVDQMDALGLFEPAPSVVHCSYAFTDDLPSRGFDPAHPRAKDAWACGMAQIFSTVGPAMHEEFEAKYVKRLFERFGLVYYGCCEPLHDRIGMVRRIQNVRKVSCSPWSRVDRMAEDLGSDYVLSRKPSPAVLASENPDWDAVDRDIRETVRICRGTGTPLEFILKDVSTVRYRPQNLWEWERRVMAIMQE